MITLQEPAPVIGAANPGIKVNRVTTAGAVRPSARINPPVSIPNVIDSCREHACFI